MTKKYVHVVVGGTFDHLHHGHFALLSRAFDQGEQVVIGVTSDDFTQTSLLKTDKYAHLIEPLIVRKKNLTDFLRAKGWLEQAEIIAIHDRFGTTLTDKNIDAIVVSPETEAIAKVINQKRIEKNWPALSIELVPWVMAQDAQPIHSTRIRGGEIDQDGSVYMIPKNWGVRKLSDELRQTLKSPLGQLITDTNHDHETATQYLVEEMIPYKKSVVISVGDAVTDALLKAGVTPDVSIIDFHIQRKKVYEQLKDFGFAENITTHAIDNPAGSLSFQAFAHVKKMLQGSFPSVLTVHGEEDLLTLAAILTAPLYSLVLYGQPNEGVVVVTVTLEKKQEILAMLQSFS